MSLGLVLPSSASVKNSALASQYPLTYDSTQKCSIAKCKNESKLAHMYKGQSSYDAIHVSASGVKKFKTTKINSEDPQQLVTKICILENYPLYSTWHPQMQYPTSQASLFIHPHTLCMASYTYKFQYTSTKIQWGKLFCYTLLVHWDYSQQWKFSLLTCPLKYTLDAKCGFVQSINCTAQRISRSTMMPWSFITKGGNLPDVKTIVCAQLAQSQNCANGVQIAFAKHGSMFHTQNIYI